MNRWEKFDYKNTDPITGGYHSILFEFIEQLREWVQTKKFV